MRSGIATPAFLVQPNHQQQRSALLYRLAMSISSQAYRVFLMAIAVCLTAVITLVEDARGQTSMPPAEQKIDRLVELLQDPELRTWLENRKTAPVSAEVAAETRPGIEAWEAELRAHLQRVISAVPSIPRQLSAAIDRVRGEVTSHHYGSVFLTFAGLVAIGLIAGRLFRKRQGRKEEPHEELLSIGVSVLVMAVFFFVVDWPSLFRLTLLAYLLALIGYRLGALLIAIVAPPEIQTRAKILLAIAVLSIATTSLARSLGADPDACDAMAYMCSVLILILGLEALWSMNRQHKLAISIAMVAVWLFWCLQLSGFFWIGIYALLLPSILRATGRIASAFFTSEAFSLWNVLIARGARAVVVGIAAAWLAFVWHMTPEGLGHSNPVATALFYGLMKSAVIVLLADLCWHLAKNWIDGTLAIVPDPDSATSAELARRARYRTLLPLLRNALAVLIIVMAGLIILSQLGVEVVPLIAGAGVFGVAIGFGSQTLVKDIISGVFYMLDDAFRVGEYIQAKNYKGTVEGFSLRSVRLRHHRGPIYTVPFGDLGAVQNMSRDWGVVKFRISVSHGADVEKIRKLTKKIGASLMDDPELGPLFIEPLKMKGIEEFADYGIVLSFGMTLRPSPMQSFIRRRANLLLREAFMTNGIEFAMPSVQVDADDKSNAAAAATATNLRTQQLKAAAAAP